MSVIQEGLKVVRERDNRLIGRKEILLVYDHLGRGTPTRKEIREHVAKMYNAPIDAVIVKNIRTEYGLCKSWIEVFIYDSPERAREIEPKYVIERNVEKGEKSE